MTTIAIHLQEAVHQHAAAALHIAHLPAAVAEVTSVVALAAEDQAAAVLAAAVEAAAEEDK